MRRFFSTSAATKVICIAVFGATVFTACRFAKRGSGDPLQDARQAFESAESSAPASELATLALDFAAQPEAPAPERVRVLSSALAAAAESQSLADLERLVPPLDASLTDMAAGPADPANGLVEMDAERALRSTHRAALVAWSGGGGDAAASLLDAAFATYRTHFSLAADYGQILWDRAEYLRRADRREEALAAYEIVIAEDVSGTYAEKAQQTIIAIWTVASEGTPLPDDVAERQPIPSPHAEWIEIARRRIDAAPTEPDSRRHLLRIADLQLAYKQTGDGYDTLRRVIAEADDRFSLDAASRMLTHFTDSNPSRRDFRALRKELQKNKFLWADRDFRQLVNGLKKRIEGK